MKKPVHDNANTKSQFIRPPACPFDAKDLWEALRSKIERQRKVPLGYEELGQMMGRPKSTAHFWFSVYGHPHLIGFMNLLERLPVQERLTFLNSYCRAYPTLTHPRIVGDIKEMETLLSEKTGITVIIGATERARTFVVNAFGHSFQSQYGGTSGAAGIDLHCPKDFVPVATVHYLDENLDAGRIFELVLSIWPKILTFKANLRLFNNVWSRVPHTRNDILRLATAKHVILADSMPPALAHLKSKVLGPVTLAHLSESKATKDLIRVELSRL